MGPSSQARIAIGLLLGLQLLTSLAAVVLLGRMSPAVDRILRENVHSTEAVEEMLGVLASERAPERFDEALQRARANITEAQEMPLIARVQERAPSALSGDLDARVEVVDALRELGHVNRVSMERTNAAASRLGLAGAWAMALLGFAGFLLNLIVRRRIEEHVLGPVLELDAVLAAVRAGDEYRRCARTDAASESQLTDNINWVLDRRLGTSDAPQEDAVLRGALLALLDARTTSPAALIDADGTIVAMNALALAGGAPLVAGLADSPLPDGWTVSTLHGGLRLAEQHEVPEAGSEVPPTPS